MAQSLVKSQGLAIHHTWQSFRTRLDLCCHTHTLRFQDDRSHKNTKWGKYVGLSLKKKRRGKVFFIYFIDCDIEMVFLFYSAAALKVAGALAFAWVY